jgi:hypothetical protein
MIGDRFNFEDCFYRDLTICVLDTLEGEVKWVNRFSSGDRQVNVPFYYSMTGDERFLLDSFNDDIVSGNRFVDVNTDIIPRGHITLTGFDIRSDEFANPNVWLKMVLEGREEIRKVLTKIRAIPITAKYDLQILLTSEIDVFKCAQAIMDTLWLYRFMYFEHNFMNIDAVMLIPDSNQIDIVREKSLTSENTIKLTLSFEVQTYYPAYRKPRFDLDGDDLNSFVTRANAAADPTSENFTGGGSGATGSTSSFTNTTGTTPTSIFPPTDPFVPYLDSGLFVYPKKTKWYNNLIEARNRNVRTSGSSIDDGPLNNSGN